MMSKAKRTCGSCIFFDKEIPKGSKKHHKDEGHKEYGKPCSMYEANPFPLIDQMNIDYVRVLASVINQLGPSHLDNLAHTILGAKRLRQHGFRFMQRVYYQWRGTVARDYINNWLAAFVAGMSRDGQELRLYSYDGSMGLSVPVTSVLTYKQWKPMFQKMRDANHVFDPQYKHLDFPAGDLPTLAAPEVRAIEEINWTGSKAENGKPFSPKASMLRHFNNLWERRDTQGFDDETDGFTVTKSSARKGTRSGKVGPASFSVTGGDTTKKAKKKLNGEKQRVPAKKVKGKGNGKISVRLVESPIDKVLGGILDV